ncbi:rhomboid family intramembrane serine protease [Nitriliruptoraceae bacterium ZYF776]|nr:rhomboid family intramembrane serine protease [Profundirhabdus halotolerans]
MSGTDGPTTTACYRHPDRPALTVCTRCERPICGDDLIEAPVGYQCPECAKGGQPVRRLRDLRPSAQLTRVLVGLLVVGFAATAGRPGSPIGQTLSLVPALVGLGEWWRIVTSGFVHAGVIHIAFNGYLLWLLGNQLEPALGRGRFATIYAGGLVGGSLGVCLLAWLTVATGLAGIPVLGDVFATSPVSQTVGASGAVFGLMGAAMVGLRRQGVNPWRSDIGGLVLLNLLLTFFLSGISVGGHLGGFAAGALVTGIVLRDRKRASLVTGIVAVVAMAVLTIALSVALFD